MIQIRIHGRGGQGVVTAAELIALAAFNDGYQAQAFPFFGVERSGAPIQAFVRLADKPITNREQIYEPDILIIQDDSLLSDINVFEGTDAQTKVIINTSRTVAEIYKAIQINNRSQGWPKLAIKEKNLFVSPATAIAIEIFHKNLANVPLVGALARYTKLINLAGIKKALESKFAGKNPTLISQNIQAALKAYSL